MIRTLACALPAIWLGLAPAQSAGAQESRTRGLVIGLDVGGAAVSFQHEPVDRGPLVGGRIGYGVNDFLTLYAAAYEADIDVQTNDTFDKVTFGHADFGVRLHLANPQRRWVPYGDVTLTLRPVSDVYENGERTTSDFSALPSSSLGVGLALYLSDSWALDANLKWGQSIFKDVELGDRVLNSSPQHTHMLQDMAVSSTRLSGGIAWWP